jgi:hypothetical protein
MNTNKNIMIYISSYSSIEEYFLFLMKFIIITHVLPIVYALLIAMHQDYLDFYVEQKTGMKPINHEIRLEKYSNFKEKKILTSIQKEAEQVNEDALLFEENTKKKLVKLFNKLIEKIKKDDKFNNH